MTKKTFTLEPENYHPKDIVKYRHLSHSGNQALLVNLYIYKNDIGLYRDDGLAIFKNISGPKSEKN